MGGYFEIRLNTGTHDPLHAKALVLEQDGVKAALVACDLESLPRSLVDPARALVEKTTGIPAAHVLISATHTHTGPEMSHCCPRQDRVVMSAVENEGFAG
jgi:hypothetical protein